MNIQRTLMLPSCQAFALLGMLFFISTSINAQDNSEQPFADEDVYQFNDLTLEQALEYPDWFKLSFLDLQEDLTEAKEAGKQGIIVYFGQKHCAYCKALLEINFKMPDIVEYTQKHFDVIPIDIWSDTTVKDLSGDELSEKDFAEFENTNFTPSLIFYDTQGKDVLRLRGYHPPYQLRAALEFVADKHYENESFRDYLQRGDQSLAFSKEELIEEDFFLSPPYFLDRSRFSAQQPLMVVFEQGDCYACEVLHNEQFTNPVIDERLQGFENVQLNIWGDTPVLTPDGKKLSAKNWAQKLNIIYTPTMVFFDRRGNEIFRIDSVVRFHRLSSVLKYIASGDYIESPYFQRWREQQQSR